MILSSIILIIYSIALLLIFLYALAQLNLLFNYLSARKNKIDDPQYDFSDEDEIPLVTIQLPVYNEFYVMKRLLENISLMDYPKDKLEIQVLDDSTDESLEETKLKIEKLKETGLDIQHLVRSKREGFKAGALKDGLKTAKGEYIAIFDSDFMPKKDWLRKTIPFFKNPEIGVVQTRWSHLNRKYSLLTRVQAFALDAHFTLEQTGRNIKGHFINFNGTAGVWRKECILDAGNWQGDTLTEDLDLSYRAQLKEWKFKYLEDVETPAELPVVMSAAKSQQFRWNKGGAENFKKMLGSIIKSKSMPLKSKVHGILHLLNSTMFLNILIVAVLSIPILYIKHEYDSLSNYFYVLSFFVLSTLIFFVCYWFVYKKMYGGGFNKFLEYIGMFVTFFSIAMGFSLHNSLAVIEGHLGKKSEFIRTPKFNISSLKDSYKGNKYLKKKLSANIVIEGLLMIYFAFGLYSAFVVGNNGDFGMFPFHLMLFLGFGYVFFKSITSRA
ncbi:Glycosyltransferase, catalytic subunit of cellulose synthase and poly-beta-1,6-N-acetylglucosamine synthase [Flavobacteriaceae bacterium MAR_2010_188]|nr:Glycosyltransferase, catalytic subunit of cellulose synthase and poly-beta-1,6-N-acetylglucosamine synthase [Flavobacteriaceae bacterium MAR_2010_188]